MPLAPDGPVVIDVKLAVEGSNAFTSIAKLRGDS